MEVLLVNYVQRWGSLTEVVSRAGEFVPADQRLSYQAVVEDCVPENREWIIW